MYIQLDEVREVQIQSCFKCNVEFHYSSSTLEFEDVLENFKVWSRASSETPTDNSIIDDDYNKENVNSFYDKNKKRDRFIIMYDVSGPADKLNKFASFFNEQSLVKQYGDRLFLRQIFLIFSPHLFHWIQLERYFKQIVNENL